MTKYLMPLAISQHKRHIEMLGDMTVSLAFVGDSIIAGSNATGTATTLETYSGVTAVADKFAQGGTVLAEEIFPLVAWWDFTNNEPSSQYTNTGLAAEEGVTEFTDVVIGLGTNDADKTSGVTINISKADWKAAYVAFITHIKTQFPSVRNVYIRPIGRHITRNDGLTEWQAVREAIYEVAAEQSGVYVMPEYYDLAIDGADNVHPADYTNMTAREAVRIAFVNGRTSVKAESPKITSAVITDSGIRATVTHVDGNDVTISGDPSRLFRPEGSIAVSIPSSITKVNATTIDLNCGPMSKGTVLTTLYGTMDQLADDGSDSIKDNSVLALPLGYSVVTPTDSDILRSMRSGSSVIFDANYPKTYTAGTTIDTIKGIDGSDWANVDTGNRMTYDAAAFDGAGAFVGSAVTSKMIDGINWTTQFVAFGSAKIPASVASEITLLQGGNLVPSVSTHFKILTTGALAYQAQQGSASTTNFGGDYRDGYVDWLIDAHGLNDWDIWINGSLLVEGYDPNDNYISTRNRVFFGGVAEFGRLYYFAGADHGEAGDPSIAAIFADLLAKRV